MDVRIGDKFVGDGRPCFIVAEAGVNHNGDINLAKKLIDAAKKAGADAVKFQAFKAEKIATRYAEKAEYQKETTSKEESQFNMLKKLELGYEDFKELYDYAEKTNIIFLSSVFDIESVDMLDDLGIAAFKVGSGELTNYPMLKRIVEKGKPIILSTGMSTMDEVEEALEFIKKEGGKDIILTHCITGYPIKKEDANLRVIETLKRRFNLPVGFSDHTTGITIPIAAAALGAVLIEKHFTLDRNLPGPDHKASLEPNELEEMVNAIRDVESALGNGVRSLTRDEEEIKKIARKSIVAKVKIPKGTIITEEMLDIKRPGTGIEPKYMSKIIGKRVRKDIVQDELIAFENVA